VQNLIQLAVYFLTGVTDPSERIPKPFQRIHSHRCGATYKDDGQPGGDRLECRPGTSGNQNIYFVNPLAQ